MSVTIYTIGHSTRELWEFLDLLRGHGIRLLVDVRRYPTSRRYPHFSREPLENALAEAGIDYRHEPDMGGWRKEVREDSPNTAWRSRGFQAYADHTDSAAFREALDRLLESAEEKETAIMCAEIVPWRCHRQIISDILVARGHDALHIVEEGKTEKHELNEHARLLDGERVVYPASEEELEQLEML